MEQTWYLKYRPQTFDELDVASVRETLKKVVASGKWPHAFLFSGPRGTGKTSAARILAKAVNCTGQDKPCNNCTNCKAIAEGVNFDVVEMDAASNRGIDEARALRENIKLRPMSGKFKVYIIDEAHMLTSP
jgi:DNA polymerase-3 subunit gamma/tau